MKYIKHYNEGIFSFFSMENKVKRKKYKETYDKVKSLVESNILDFDCINLYDKSSILYNPSFKPNSKFTLNMQKYQFKINDDSSIDIYGNVRIINLKNLDLKFNKVFGNFRIKQSYLENFNNLPIFSENLSIIECGLNSFSELPKNLESNHLFLYGNNILSLKDAPNVKYIDLDLNDIYSLDNLNLNIKYELSQNPIDSIQILRKDKLYSLYNICKTENNYDLYTYYDPIHPSDKGKPKLYMKRLYGLLNEIFKDSNYILFAKNQINGYYEVIN